MAQKQIIAQGRDVSAIKQELGGDTVVVAFNEMGATGNGDSFWGDRFFERLGVTAIGVMTPRPNWYPKADMEGVLSAIRTEAAGRKIVTYGHSQGGYGALKFSGALGASAALALCPQWSINPRDVGEFDTRFIEHHVPDKQAGEAIVSTDVGQNAFVLYDPKHALDTANVERIGAAASINKVPIPYSEHEVIRVFTEARCAAELLQLVILGDASVRAIRQLARCARRQSSTHVRNLANRLLERRVQGGRLMDGLAGRPGAQLDFHAALLAVLHGDEASGLESLRIASTDPRLAPKMLDAWVLFRGAKNPRAERILATALLNPNRDLWPQLHGVQSLILAGEKAAAATELERLSLHADAPNRADYFNRLRALL